jgi:hypothetical protein
LKSGTGSGLGGNSGNEGKYQFEKKLHFSTGLIQKNINTTIGSS